MRGNPLLATLMLGIGAPALAQDSGTRSITLYELPAYLGRSVTVTAPTSNLAALGFAKKAQSARVKGSWEVCPQAEFKGSCQTLNANVQVFQLLGLSGQIASVRPIGLTATPATGSATTGSATTATKVNLADLDVDEGTEGQDTTFFARPAFQGSQVSAGSNDRTAADTFCKQAGHASSVYAARARTQVSNIIDVAAGTRVRGYPLRDVLCRK